MKKYFIFASVALAFAACSSEESMQQTKEQTTQGEVPLLFDAYVNRTTTRAGLPSGGGPIGTAAQLQGNSFGVFGYYTDNEVYSETATPNFMYNEKISYSASKWSYAPVKYWPNEFGTNAASERVDHLTFFAYAPWVEVTPETGMLVPQAPATHIDSNETGILGLTRNTAIGDPLVKYAVDFDTKDGVDLLWGVSGGDALATVNGGPQQPAAGSPFIDLIKTDKDDPIKFNFHHALAWLNVQIDADVDDVRDGTSDHANERNDNTRIYVRSVTFEGFSTKGSFNLNSPIATPTWYDQLGSGELSTIPVSIFDGRRDGREGVTTASASNEMPQGLNPVLIQDGTAKDGVTKTAVNLFNSSDDTYEWDTSGDTDKLIAPVFVIPNGQEMKVTIVYDVETVDGNLATFLSDGQTHGSVVENAITKDITTSTDAAIIMSAGLKYTIKLHLGMTSVKVDADVEPWGANTDGNADLPINKD